jgi:hypothetical protein
MNNGIRPAHRVSFEGGNDADLEKKSSEKGRSLGRRSVAKLLSLHDGHTLWRAQLVTEDFILRLANQALRSMLQRWLLQHQVFSNLW